MDKNEPFIAHVITEEMMICKDCAFRGSAEGWSPGKCWVYDNKPISISAALHGATCVAYINEKEVQ